MFSQFQTDTTPPDHVSNVSYKREVGAHTKMETINLATVSMESPPAAPTPKSTSLKYSTPISAEMTTEPTPSPPAQESM